MIIVKQKMDKVILLTDREELDQYIQSLQQLYLDAVNRRVSKARIKQKDYKILDFLEFEEVIK